MRKPNKQLAGFKNKKIQADKIHMKKLVLPFAATGFLVAGLLNPSLFWLSWLAFAVFFLFIQQNQIGLLEVFGLTFISFGIYFSVFFYWLTYYQILMYVAAVILLAATFSGYFVFIGWMSRKIKNDILKILFAMFVWFLFEMACSFTPFGSAILEMPFYGPLEFLQIISIIQMTGFAALVVGLASALAIWAQKKSCYSALWFFIFLIGFAGIYFWGLKRLEGDVGTKNKIKVAFIQHNLPMNGMWRLEHAKEIKNKYRELANRATKESPDFIIFPLYSLPEDPLRNPEFFAALSRQLNTAILLGTHVPNTANASVFKEGFFNVALFFTPTDGLFDQYRAVEKAPSFSKIRESTAKKYKILHSPFGKLGVLLCYEDTKPKITKQAIKQGAKLLIALSNPGHFTTTRLPQLHLMQDRLRAIESARWLLRVSANGYSALVDNRGRIKKQSSLNQEEILFVEAALD